MYDSEPHARRICGAKTRSGNPCQNAPVTGRDRCRMHGGAQKRGIARHNTISGRYSKHLPTRLGERYEAALKDPDLLALRDEIALTDADIGRLLALVEEDEPEHKNKTAREEWQRDQRRIRTNIHELIENRRRLVETERKRLVDMQQMMSTEQAMLLLSAVVDIVRKRVHDRDVLADISSDIERLVAHRGR